MVAIPFPRGYHLINFLVIRMRQIKEIILHCSDSRRGDTEEIRKWHTRQGWSDIGYHYVICNGWPKWGRKGFSPTHDGLVQPGRPIEKIGAHVRGRNRHSIGICLVGKDQFTAKQLLDSGIELIISLLDKYGLGFYNVLGHYEIDKRKTCPNIDMLKFRGILRCIKKERDALKC